MAMSAAAERLQLGLIFAKQEGSLPPLGNLINGKGVILAAAFLLAAIGLLAWPAREQVSVAPPADEKGSAS